MIVLGLTGSIGMGKSTAANMLRVLGVPVFDSDAEVRRVQAPGGVALPAIAAAFPGVVTPAGLDRTALAAAVFGRPEALRRLEAIIHPLVREGSRLFLRRAALRGAPVVVLDVPLLFETGGDRRCDAVIVVSAPAFIQRQRVMRRPGMTAETFERILARQMPDREKRRRADWVAPSGLGRAETFRHLRRILLCAKRMQPRVIAPGALVEGGSIRRHA